VCFKRRWF